jgi:cobalt/nickel transport system permease protein
MHMSDALLSPAVGGALWAATAAVGARAAAVLRRSADERQVPLMGVLGAFVFAAQMVNFAIPGTGSSGHVAGGILLAALLGPHAAFLVMASVLTIQALFFADGGLLALGCNVFNMGFLPAFVVHPLLFRPLVGAGAGRGRVLRASVLASVVALAAGALAVVVETAASGISSLPLGPFLALMIPIHVAIGVVEGLVTGLALLALWRVRPELAAAGAARRGLGPALVGLGAAAALTAGVLSWFASAHPDGLEWAVARAGVALPAPATAVHQGAARLQERTAILPDYTVPGQATGRAGTSLAGLVGAGLTLLAGLGAGHAIRRLRRAAASPPSPSGAVPPAA